MNTVQAVLKPLRHEIRSCLSNHPRLFFPLYGLRKKNRNLTIKPNSDLLIEGFPRSANTFSVLAFSSAQSRKVHVGSHLHVQAHIYRALEFDIPVILLIRKPKDAVISLVLREPCLSLAQTLRFYIKFHQDLLPVRERILLARFEDVTADFGMIIQQCNEKFGTTFTPFEHSKENAQKVFQFMENRMIQRMGHGDRSERHVGRPSKARKYMSAKLHDQLGQPHMQNLLSQAERAYTLFTA